VTTGEIVGRGDELGYVCGFLDRADRGLRAVVLEGAAGIGKSTVWAAGLAAARERGFRVLSSRPAEAERGLAHVALGDLFESVVDDVLPVLSPPQRYALEGALLTSQAPEYAVDPRALGVAIRTSFRVLSETDSLVLAIDDCQWVDPSSTEALAFALRRLRTERILLLLARRVDERGGGPALEEALDSDAVERLHVGPLSIGAVRALLQGRLGRTFAPPTLRRLHQISDGNPFYALELARGLGPEGASGDPMEPFPVPETLERLVTVRLAGLGDATREALLLVAAHGRPSFALLKAAEISSKTLEPAFAAHVVERSDALVRFTHPLLASALYQGAPEEQRRGAHHRLAAVVDDPIERGRHLALASETPDEVVAAALEATATDARARGTAIAAAEFAEHALRLTPARAPEDQHRRTIAAAQAHLEAGDARRASALAVDLLARATAGERAEALVLLSDCESAVAQPERAIDLRKEALEHATGTPSLQAEIHEWLGREVHYTEGTESADRHALAALDLAEGLDDDALRAGALSALAHSRFRAGHPDALRLVDQAAQLAAATADPRRRRDANLGVVHATVWSSQFDRARRVLESIDREWSERDELTKGLVLWWLGLIQLRSGEFAAAADNADRSREIWRQYTIDDREEPPSLHLVALIAAHRGELERARALVESYLPQTERLPMFHAQADAVLALVELWSGDLGAATGRFAAADAEMRGTGGNEPAMFWWRADHTEALLGLGRLDEAATLLHGWEAEAARLDREALLAAARRCRGLLAAARGEIEEALAELERAVAQHEAAGDPFGRARALLALGIVRRRVRQQRAAREAIEAALESFEACGAAGWAEKARAELGRIGGRARTEGLTPAEGRIATLAAEGRTNREVAAALFLTEHTVETVLSRAYRKLGIRSRAALASRLANETVERPTGNS